MIPSRFRSFGCRVVLIVVRQRFLVAGKLIPLPIITWAPLAIDALIVYDAE